MSAPPLIRLGGDRLTRVSSLRGSHGCGGLHSSYICRVKSRAAVAGDRRLRQRRACGAADGHLQSVRANPSAGAESVHGRRAKSVSLRSQDVAWKLAQSGFQCAYGLPDCAVFSARVLSSWFIKINPSASGLKFAKRIAIPDILSF